MLVRGCRMLITLAYCTAQVGTEHPLSALSAHFAIVTCSDLIRGTISEVVLRICCDEWWGL